MLLLLPVSWLLFSHEGSSSSQERGGDRNIPACELRITSIPIRSVIPTPKERGRRREGKSIRLLRLGGAEGKEGVNKSLELLLIFWLFFFFLLHCCFSASDSKKRRDSKEGPWRDHTFVPLPDCFAWRWDQERDACRNWQGSLELCKECFPFMYVRFEQRIPGLGLGLPTSKAALNLFRGKIHPPLGIY